MKNLFARSVLSDIARANPLVYFDIGARGGFQSDLYPIAFAVDAVGFEPNPAEYGRLKQTANGLWKSVTMLPHGVAATSGRQTLYVPENPESASLMKHNTAIGEKFDKRQYFQLARTEEVETLDLRDALQATGFSVIDMLKIDIEGAELAVMQAVPHVMARVLAVKTEVSFMDFRLRQPQADELAGHMRQAGFELMDFIAPAHWRRHGLLVHPYVGNGRPAYSRGQIAQADALFFRNPDTLGDDAVALIKLALIAMAHGYFDHALMVLERPAASETLRRDYGLAPLEIVAPLSKVYGRKVFLRCLKEQVRGGGAVPAISP